MGVFGDAWNDVWGWGERQGQLLKEKQNEANRYWKAAAGAATHGPSHPPTHPTSGAGAALAELGPTAKAYEQTQGGEAGAISQYRKDATKAQQAAATKAASDAKAKEEQQIASSPWTLMGDALAQNYLSASQQAQSLMSGAAYPAAAQQATSDALALTGLGAGSGGAQWLQDELGAANAVTAPVAQAMQAQSQAYANQAGPISNAIRQWGQANAIGEITAPEASWLNALSSHISSNVNLYGYVPTVDLPTFQTNPALAEAYKSSGGYGGAGGTGLTSITASGFPFAPTTKQGTAVPTGFAGLPTGTSIPGPGGTPSS